MKIAITGANGNLGRRLIDRLAPHHQLRAIVRSERARQTLLNQFGSDLDIVIVDYGDVEGLTGALNGFDKIVHLVGIIKESAANPFERAHEQACAALVRAASAAGLRGIVHLSIVGASETSTNACLASRGRADRLLVAGDVPATVIRVPMVLGEGDYASAALVRQAKRSVVFTFRAASLEQPIYAGDVVAALETALAGDAAGIVELAGPETLSRRDLIERMAAVIGREPPLVVSLPLGLGMMIAAIAERRANPPVTRAMLGVLDHDDRIDVVPTCERLGLKLTPLDEMLRHILPD